MLDDQRTKPIKISVLDEPLYASSLNGCVPGKNVERLVGGVVTAAASR
jgi:hypothetical protein